MRPCWLDRSQPGRSTSPERASWCSGALGANRGDHRGASSARVLALTPRHEPNLDRLASDRLGCEGVLARDRHAVAEQAAPEAYLATLERPVAAVAVVAAAHGGVG